MQGVADLRLDGSLAARAVTYMRRCGSLGSLARGSQEQAGVTTHGGVSQPATGAHDFVMNFAFALLLLYELADKGDERFAAAAARWHARFTLEAGLPLDEAEMVMRLLCGVRGANRLIVRRQLLAFVDRAGLSARDMAA